MADREDSANLPQGGPTSTSTPTTPSKTPFQPISRLDAQPGFQPPKEWFPRPVYHPSTPEHIRRQLEDERESDFGPDPKEMDSDAKGFVANPFWRTGKNAITRAYGHDYDNDHLAYREAVEVKPAEVAESLGSSTPSQNQSNTDKPNIDKPYPDDPNTEDAPASDENASDKDKGKGKGKGRESQQEQYESMITRMIKDLPKNVAMGHDYSVTDRSKQPRKPARDDVPGPKPENTYFSSAGKDFVVPTATTPTDPHALNAAEARAKNLMRLDRLIALKEDNPDLLAHLADCERVRKEEQEEVTRQINARPLNQGTPQTSVGYSDAKKDDLVLPGPAAWGGKGEGVEKEEKKTKEEKGKGVAAKYTGPIKEVKF